MGWDGIKGAANYALAIRPIQQLQFVQFSNCNSSNSAIAIRPIQQLQFVQFSNCNSSNSAIAIRPIQQFGLRNAALSRHPRPQRFGQLVHHPIELAAQQFVELFGTAIGGERIIDEGVVQHQFVAQLFA